MLPAALGLAVRSGDALTWIVIFEKGTAFPCSASRTLRAAPGAHTTLYVPVGTLDSSGSWQPAIDITVARPGGAPPDAAIDFTLRVDAGGNPNAEATWSGGRLRTETEATRSPERANAVLLDAPTIRPPTPAPTAAPSQAVPAPQTPAVTASPRLTAATLLARLRDGHRPVSDAREGVLAALIEQSGDDASRAALGRVSRLLERDAERGVWALRWCLGDRSFPGGLIVDGGVDLVRVGVERWELLVEAAKTGALADWLRFSVGDDTLARRIELSGADSPATAVHQVLWSYGWRGLRLGGRVLLRTSEADCAKVGAAHWAETVASGLVDEWLMVSGLSIGDRRAFLEAVEARRLGSQAPNETRPRRRMPWLTAVLAIFGLGLVGAILAGAYLIFRGTAGQPAPVTTAVAAEVVWTGTMEGASLRLELTPAAGGPAGAVRGRSIATTAAGTSTSDVSGTFDVATGKLSLIEDEPNELAPLLGGGAPRLPKAHLAGAWKGGTFTGKWWLGVPFIAPVREVQLSGPAPIGA